MEASNGDVAFHCPGCGTIFDMEISRISKAPDAVRRKPAPGIPDLRALIFEAGSPRAWALSPQGMATIKVLRSEGCSNEQIAKALGVARPTLYMWAKADPDFAAIMDVGSKESSE